MLVWRVGKEWKTFTSAAFAQEAIMEFDKTFDDNEMQISPDPGENVLSGLDEVAGECPDEAKLDAGSAAAEAAQLKSENAALLDKYLRVEADYQNYRKRVAKDMANVRAAAVAETLEPFIQLFDHFTMAINAAATAKNPETVVQGLKMIDDRYGKILEELHVSRFDAVNTPFDPALHEAVANEYSGEVPEGVVIRQWNSGYKLGDKVLRPARVVVSSGPAPKGESEE